MKMGIIGIHYTEYDQSSYKSVYAVLEGQPAKSFASGNPSVDVIEANNWLYDNGCEHISFSSSFDHFLRDGNDWRWDDTYLIVSNKEGV